jgi:translation initiation factor 5A
LFVTSFQEYALLDVDDGFLSLMLPDGGMKEDVKVPEGELGDQIKAEFADGKELLVTILTAMGEEACVSFSGFQAAAAMCWFHF